MRVGVGGYDVHGTDAPRVVVAIAMVHHAVLPPAAVGAPPLYRGVVVVLRPLRDGVPFEAMPAGQCAHVIMQVEVFYPPERDARHHNHAARIVASRTHLRPEVYAKARVCAVAHLPVVGFGDELRRVGRGAMI